DDVPLAKSPFSTTAVRKPRSAASRAIPAPVIPPPTTSTSTGSAAIAASAWARVRCENSVSVVGVPPAWPARRHGGRFRSVSAEENVMPMGNGRRVAVVAGCRTPFCRAGSVLKYVRAMDLSRYAARELLERTNLDGDEVDEVVWGQVVPSPLVPNVGREVSLLPQLPKEIPAYSLNRACASSNQAITNAHDQIASGHADVILVGGVETLSDVPILVSRGLADILVDASKAKSLAARLGVLSRIRPRHLAPVTP